MAPVRPRYVIHYHPPHTEPQKQKPDEEASGASIFFTVINLLVVVALIFICGYFVGQSQAWEDGKPSAGFLDEWLP
jgi:hypothetical protein